MNRPRALLVAVLLLPACAREAPVEPAPAPVVVEPQPEPAPPKPRKGGKGGGLGAAVGGGAADTVGGLLTGSAPTPAAAAALKEKFQQTLVGTWVADLGDGYRQELTYTADGTYSAQLTGPAPASASGKYTVLQAIGTRALKLKLGEADGRTITVTFDGDTIEHPSLRPGVTGTFRKK